MLVLVKVMVYLGKSLPAPTANELKKQYLESLVKIIIIFSKLQKVRVLLGGK